ncbi:MAG: UDP-N-acetylglucosamine 1-carboxyvinyltransferase [Acutalibacteraceae bacterium]|nr:UDP-N-acetylglucosamine 1-carboxyvinyltransferase [Acutalibacteraceae bacterium]
MSKLRITGGKKLSGEITLQGSKNSALPIIAASLMVQGKTVLHNCPDLSDVLAALKILQALGCRCHRIKNDIYIDASNVNCDTVPNDLMREMRSSVVFLGAILSRCLSATISAPGGCELGPRPIDLHLSAISQMGYSVAEDGGYILCKREYYPKRVQISLDFPSVGATENIILASCMSKGTVLLHNAAKEPEIADLADFINKSGGRVYGAGTDTIEIIGVSRLYSVEHTVIPDRIVAATYMSAAAVTGGNVLIKNVNSDHVRSIVNSFRKNGCEIKQDGTDLNISISDRPKRIKATRSTVYPGFPTDAGPLLVATLVKAEGTSVFVETIFENRFNYIGELLRLGADIKVYNRVATIEGVKRLHGAELSCTDLRGGAAMVIASLAAEGVSVIDKICHIERGYENIEENLRALSADIVKI